MAYAPTPADIIDFRAYYDPDFANATDAQVSRALIIAADEVSGALWPTVKALPGLGTTRRGLYAYAAHWLFMKSRSATAGAATPFAVASKSVGDESVSYAVPAAGTDRWADWLGLTEYGMDFIHLRCRLYAARVV